MAVRSKTARRPVNRQSSAKSKQSSTTPIGSEQRMDALLAETEAELARLQPQIEKLEKQVEKLRDLKQTKQKLITLKLSLQSIIDNFGKETLGSQQGPEYGFTPGQEAVIPYQPLGGFGGYFPVAPKNALYDEVTGKLFLPDQAFAQIGDYIRRRHSLNMELFRAVVFNGGKATTEQIKDYLITHNVTLPSTGETFEEAPLSDISSRTNYLVRKGILKADGRGHFISLLGWADSSP